MTGYSQNLITNGTFDDATGWTVVNQYGTDSTNGLVSFANGEVTIEKVDPTDGGWIHMGFYTEVDLTAGWYQFDMDMDFENINEIWGEMYIGANEPVQNEEYFGDQQVIKAYNAWDCEQTYTGQAVASGCDDSFPGLFEITNDGTYYLLFRSGGNNFGTSGVKLDNLSLVAATAPNLNPLSEFNYDFNDPTPIESENLTYDEEAVNTVTDGINSSVNIAELDGVNNDWFSQIKVVNNDGIDLSSGDRGFSIKVKGPRTSTLTIKVESGGTEHAVTADYSTPNEWQELLFDFTSFNSTNNTKIALFFDIQTNFDETEDPNLNIFQIDDFVFGEYTTLNTREFDIAGLTIYPNPTNDVLNISTLNQIISLVEIYDMTGKNVISEKSQSLAFKIDTSILVPGVYIIKMNTQNGFVTRKIIKQ
jgi:hypothetical protein